MKTKFISFLITGIILMSTKISNAQTTTTFRLNPNDEDAQIQNYTPNLNESNIIEYYLGGWTVGGTPVKWRQLLKFNLSSIPSNAIVQSANLYRYYPTSNVNHSFHYDTSLTHSNAFL